MFPWNFCLKKKKSQCPRRNGCLSLGVKWSVGCWIPVVPEVTG